MPTAQELNERRFAFEVAAQVLNAGRKARDTGLPVKFEVWCDSGHLTVTVVKREW